MKRICSLLLSLLLFLDALPWQSLALARAEDETAADGISSDVLRMALALTGFEDGAPEWREGMTLNECTNAAQILDFLQDVWDDDFEGIMDSFQDMYTFLENYTDPFNTDENAQLGTFYSAYRAAQDLQDEILYYMDELDDSSHRICSLNDRIFRKDPRESGEELYDTSELEDVLYGEEIETEFASLKDAKNAVIDNFESWNSRFDALALMLWGDAYTENTPPGLKDKKFDALVTLMDAKTTNPPPTENPVMHGAAAAQDGSAVLLSREVALPSAASPSCLERLSPIRSALADNKQSVGVTVLDDKAFIIRTKDGKANLGGVSVTALDVDKNGKPGKKKNEKTAKSDEKGMAKYMVRDFSPDGNGAMWVSLKCSKNGYRTLSSPCVSIGKGTVFNVAMQKDDGTPYVIEATLNGRDMLANSCELVVGDKFIDKSTMHFLVNSKGKPYTFKLYYTKDNKQTVLLEESGSGQVNEPSHDLKDKQLSKMIPGGAKLFVEIKSGGKVQTTPLKLTVTAAVVDQPMTLPGVANIFNRNLVFGLPSSWPGPLGKTKIQIDIPVVKMWPVNAMILPNGMGFIMIGFKHSKPIDKKNADAQALAAGVKAVEQEGWRRVQEFKSGGAKDYTMPLWKLGSFGLEIGFLFCGVGQLGDAGGDSLRALRLRGSVGGTAKASGEYQFNVYGIVNFGVTGYLNATLTIGLGVNIFFARKQGSFSYHSWEFSPANSGWTLNMRLEIGVFVGLGYKGVCGANVTGYGFLELAVRGTPGKGGTTGVAIRGTNSYDMSYELIGGFGARLTLQFFFIKAIYQLGDEIKWQLLPTFKRLSSRDSMLERFISAVRPPVAAADTPPASDGPALSSIQQLNSRLLLDNKTINNDVRPIQNAYADNIQFATLKDQYNNKEDYAFYLKKHVNSSNKVEDYVDLYSMTTGKNSQTSIRDTLHRFVEDGDANNSMYKIRNRIVRGPGVSKELLEGDIWKYDVVGYSISPISNYTSFKADLVAVCMLLAKDYQEVTVGDGDKTRKVRLPKETYCMLATMVPLAGARLEPMGYVIPGYYQFCCVFKVDSKVPVCNPQVDGQLFTHVIKVNNNTWKNHPHQGDRFIINIIFPTVNPAKAGDVCCYRIEAPMMGELTDSKRSSKSNIGWFFQKSTGLECSSNLREYTLRNIQAGNQTMVPTNEPQWRFQGHWYAIASPKDKPNARQLVMSNGNGQKGVILEDSGEVVDYLIYHKTWVNPANNIKMPGENCPNNKEYLLMLVKDPKSGKTCIKSVEVTLERKNKVLTFKQAEVKNFAVPASTNKLNVLRRVVGNTDLVWWMEASTPEKNQSKKALWLVKGCWMNVSDNLLTHPFVLAAISESDAGANKVSGMPAFHIFSNSRSTDPFKEVLSGIYLIKQSANDKQEVEGKVKDVTLNYKRFKFNLVPELDIAGAAMTRDIVAPGSYDDLEFTVHNNGNMPIDSFTVGIYSKEKNTSTKLGYAHVDCLRPEKCSVVFFKPNQPNIPQAAFSNKMTNNKLVETAVRRTQSSLGRPVTDRTAIQTVTFGQSGQSAGKSTRAYKATRLFPDEFATFSVRVLIPAKWQGSHTLVAKIERFYVNGKGIDAPEFKPTKRGALPYPPRMETLRAIQSPFRLLDIPSALAEDENTWNAEPITEQDVVLPSDISGFSQLTDDQIKSYMQNDYDTYDNSQGSSADKLANIDYFKDISSKYNPGYVAPAEFEAEFLEFSPGTNGAEIRAVKYKNSLDASDNYSAFTDAGITNQSAYFGDSGTSEDLFENKVNFDEFALDLDDHDLEIDADMWDNDGETMVTVYLWDDAYTKGDTTPQVVTLRSYIDYEETPAFTWVYDSKNARDYSGLEITDTTGWNLDIPLTVLTGGKRPAVLTLEVEGNGYREQAYSNNVLQIYLDSGEFQIDRQPEDRTIYVGSNTTFSVEVSGGMKTYDYRWQMKRPGGQWTDLDEGYMRRIELTGVPLEMDGTLFRCIITDSTGRELITREARLTVLRLPLTGDDKPVETWGLLAISLPCLLAFALFLLLRRRRT